MPCVRGDQASALRERLRTGGPEILALHSNPEIRLTKILHIFHGLLGILETRQLGTLLISSHRAVISDALFHCRPGVKLFGDLALTDRQDNGSRISLLLRFGRSRRIPLRLGDVEDDRGARGSSGGRARSG
jgi:hypothetical protein